MENTLAEKANPNWFWQDYFSTYRFWGVVLASFLMTLTSRMSGSGIFRLFSELGYNYRSIAAVWPFANILAIFIILYFLRKKFKLALIVFAAIVGFSTALTFSGLVKMELLFLILKLLSYLGSVGFTVSAIALLVSGRPTVGTFLITYSVILFWTGIAGLLGNALIGATEVSEFRMLISLPAILAVVALLFMSRKMFSGAPDIDVDSSSVIKRSAGAVFLFSAFIPFYFLYWLSQRPGELKTLAPNMRQPTGGGAISMAIFAPFILPIWFHDVRADLADRLPGRSPKWLAVMAFIFPTIAAAMAQSDNNLLGASGEEDLWTE